MNTIFWNFFKWIHIFANFLMNIWMMEINPNLNLSLARLSHSLFVKFLSKANVNILSCNWSICSDKLWKSLSVKLLIKTPFASTKWNGNFTTCSHTHLYNRSVKCYCQAQPKPQLQLGWDGFIFTFSNRPSHPPSHPPGHPGKVYFCQAQPSPS